MKIFWLFTALLFLLLPGSATGQIVRVDQHEYWVPLDNFMIEFDKSDPEVRQLMSRWDQLGEELKADSTVGGTYRMDSYNSYFLRWAPGNGFIYVYTSERLSIIDFSFGKVEMQGGVITFIPERQMRETYRNTKLVVPTKWITARSSQGSFFIRVEEVNEFADYAAGLGV